MPVDGRPRRPFLGKIVFAVVAAAVLLGAAGTGALLAYQGRYTDRIYPGVTVDGIDIGGMDRALARATLETGLAGYGRGTVVVTAGERTVEIPFSAANRRADIESALDNAFSVGRTGDGVARAADGVGSLFGGTRLQAGVLLDDTSLAQAVEEAAAAVDEGMVAAGAVVTETGFVATPAVAGRGLDRAALARAISAALADPKAPPTLSLNGRLTAIEPEITDQEATAAIALAQSMARDVVLTIGKESWKISGARVRTWVQFQPDPTGTLVPTIADDAPLKSVQALTKKVNREPLEASFTFSRSNGSIGVKPSKDGRKLDVAATTTAVVTALRQRVADAQGGSGATPPPVPMVVSVKEPRLTTAKAKAAAPKLRKISSWTTYYEVSERNGFGNNISIPARDLDGHVVAPGATFDFWKSIGPVTYGRGYRDGGAIINGRSQPTGALAGGICSTSTTLFNAVARAGYETKSKKNHSYFIPRYPTGLDATVVISGNSVVTMSWVNDTPYPVLIRSSASPGVVTFSLYTVPVNKRAVVGGGFRTPGASNVTYKVANGRTVTFTTGPKTGYNKATSSVEYTNSLPPGKREVKEFPVDGFKVSVTRTVLENGKVIHRDTWFSNYARVNGLTLIGKAKAKPKPSATPSPAAPAP